MQFSHDGKGRIARVLDPSARTPLGQIERWRKFFVPFEPVRDPQSWARGWRALWAMLDRDADLPTGPMVLLAMNAIDAGEVSGIPCVISGTGGTSGSSASPTTSFNQAGLS